eukprot:6196516-Pyramimonas_sp.AAC.1
MRIWLLPGGAEGVVSGVHPQVTPLLHPGGAQRARMPIPRSRCGGGSRGGPPARGAAPEWQRPHRQVVRHAVAAERGQIHKRAVRAILKI